MKSIYFIMIAFLVAGTACTKEDRSNQSNDIYASWELVEIFINDGASNSSWQQPDTSYRYNFYEDNTFTSSRFEECDFGVFTISGNIIELHFGCEGFTVGIEDQQGVFIEEYSIENNHLILNPTYLNCDEGCGWKFKRIQSE